MNGANKHPQLLQQTLHTNKINRQGMQIVQLHNHNLMESLMFIQIK